MAGKSSLYLLSVGMPIHYSMNNAGPSSLPPIDRSGRAGASDDGGRRRAVGGRAREPSKERHFKTLTDDPMLLQVELQISYVECPPMRVAVQL